MKNLERLLGSLLVLQILVYFMGLKLSYDASHNGQSSIDFSSLTPFIFFIIIGLINLFLLIISVSRFQKIGKKQNMGIVILVIINVILLLGYSYLINFVSTLPGSDLPGY